MSASQSADIPCRLRLRLKLQLQSGRIITWDTIGTRSTRWCLRFCFSRSVIADGTPPSAVTMQLPMWPLMGEMLFYNEKTTNSNRRIGSPNSDRSY